MARTSCRVALYARLEEERVGQVGVVSYSAFVAWGGHILHVGSPSQPRTLDLSTMEDLYVVQDPMGLQFNPLK